jgi:hypothetical protein
MGFTVWMCLISRMMSNYKILQGQSHEKYKVRRGSSWFFESSISRSVKRLGQ